METLGPLNTIGLLILGAALLWSVHLVYGARRRGGDDLMWRVLVVTGWLLILAGCLGMLVGMLSWIAIGFWLMLIVVLLMALGKYQDAERKSLLWVLAVAAEKGIPLPGAARSLAEERSPWAGRGAAQLADLLERGVPLPQALEQSRQSLPMDALLAARFGTRTGRLGAALRRVPGRTGAQEAAIRSCIEKLLYLSLIVLLGTSVLSFFSLLVVPRYSMLLASFGVAPSWLTQLAINACDWLARLWPLGVPVFLAMLAFNLVALLYYVGWLRTDLPLLGWIWQRHDSALVLRCLALAVREGQPLLSALVMLSEEFPRRRVRRRLRAAVQRMNSGSHWCDSLWRSGLLKHYELAVLKSAERAGNLAWALDEMADSAMRRLTLRLNTAISWIVPPLFVMFGIMVGVLVVGMLLPLAQLIEGLV